MKMNDNIFVKLLNIEIITVLHTTHVIAVIFSINLLINCEVSRTKGRARTALLLAA